MGEGGRPSCRSYRRGGEGEGHIRHGSNILPVLHHRRDRGGGDLTIQHMVTIPVTPMSSAPLLNILPPALRR